MSETANNEATSTEAEKPVQANDDVNLPLFPDPTDNDFEEDISQAEKEFYKIKFLDLNAVRTLKLHCTACDRHLGSSARNEARMRSHPMLRTLMCHTCHSFYNSGEFEKGEDGSELYCRWCGQGGQVYCCSDCPHVFCAKCIKRNLGVSKIKEIENTDDWKCFKCNNTCLWDLRAISWALLRYCDLKNKLAHETQDIKLKEKLLNDCSIDYAECCKQKQNKRKERSEMKKKDDAVKKAAASLISKMPPTIQVKKFASINLEDTVKSYEKRPQKRPASPKKLFIKNPIPVGPCPKSVNPIAVPPLAKKMRMPAMLNPIRFPKERMPIPPPNLPRIRPRAPQVSVTYLNNQFNGFNSSGLFNPMNDNINLSLESLTQGLDMAAVSRLANNSREDDVVCTPDFPMEPLCEVTEDNTDDDVQCITPAPVTAPKVNTPPPLIPRPVNSANVNDMSSDNIIQMTDNDVTVNTLTGGLKFRVDPQTLSSNKMYRLPDGRIFAINANPNMPGGYSATIVALSDNNTNKTSSKGPTYAAKLSAVSSQPSTPVVKTYTPPSQPSTSKRSSNKKAKATKRTETARECDLNVPIEWYRYNLIDAVDALEYSLSRLQKLKREATTVHLRTRNISEMRTLHKTLERLLTTSTTRFQEIRENLNKEMRQYALKKSGAQNHVSDDDDDDVEILNDLDDDPIFIDENSMESNANDTNDIDLTVASSELNDSDRVKRGDQSSFFRKISLKQTEFDHSKDPADTTNVIECNSSGDKLNVDDNIQLNGNESELISPNDSSEFVDSLRLSTLNDNNKSTLIDKEVTNAETEVGSTKEEFESPKEVIGSPKEEVGSTKKDDGSVAKVDESPKEGEGDTKDVESIKEEIESTEKEVGSTDKDLKEDRLQNESANEGDKSNDKLQESEISESKLNESEFNEDKIDDIEMSEDKSQDAEMSEEMIETLLKDDVVEDDTDIKNSNSMDAT